VHNGQLVEELTRDDFEVSTTASGATSSTSVIREEPLDFVLLFDTSLSMPLVEYIGSFGDT
jgi:hypothetical protein